VDVWHAGAGTAAVFARWERAERVSVARLVSTGVVARGLRAALRVRLRAVRHARRCDGNARQALSIAGGPLPFAVLALAA
jgi:hypothetical protein